MSRHFGDSRPKKSPPQVDAQPLRGQWSSRPMGKMAGYGRLKKDYSNMGKTMPFLPPIFLGMVNIASIKMVMTGGWLLLFYPHIKAKWWHFVWEWRGTLSEGNFGFVEYLRRIAPRQPGMHGGQALGHAAQLEANKREKALRKECVCVCVF